jgi:hypothetical protein
MPDPLVVIEFVGEGKTDLGEVSASPAVQAPDRGVLPILVHKLCAEPVSMRVIRRKFQLQQGGLKRKLWFAQQQAAIRKSAGLAFVIDTEGESVSKMKKELQEGRDEKYNDLPTAVGVAHPCIEAWLLADPDAIAKGMKLDPLSIPVPSHPEKLPAPCKERKVPRKNHTNPKTALADCVGSEDDLATKHTTVIARHLDVGRLEARCPTSFKPFADEVRERLLPLFSKAITIEEEPESSGEECA